MGVCCWGTGDPLRPSATCTSTSFNSMNREGSPSKGCWQVEQRWGSSQETADETETAADTGDETDSFLLSAGDDMASRRTTTGEQANCDRRAGEQASRRTATGERANGNRRAGERQPASGRTATGRTGEQANGERRAGEQANRTAGERRRV